MSRHNRRWWLPSNHRCGFQKIVYHPTGQALFYSIVGEVIASRNERPSGAKPESLECRTMQLMRSPASRRQSCRSCWQSLGSRGDG